PGDTFTISSSFDQLPGGTMSTTAPDWAYRLEAILKAQLQVSLVIKLLGEDVLNEPLYDSGSIDLSSSLFDTDMPGFKEGVDKGSGQFNLLEGIILGWWGFPKVVTTGGQGPGNTLVSSGFGDVVRLDFSITDAVLFLFGF